MDDTKKMNFSEVDKNLSTIKHINEKEFRNISSKYHFGRELLIKDYYLTLILYLLKDVKGIFFKGGTALQKTFLNYARLSEDADYTVTRDVSDVKREIKNIILESGVFDKVTKDKEVHEFTRLVVHYKGLAEGTIFIDLNKRAKLLLESEKHEINHFYSGFIPSFSLPMLAKKEMVAEKMAATISLNKPRDHYDLYKIIKASIPIDINLVKNKCKQAGIEFSIIRMFNRGNRLKNRWDKDMIPLLAEEVSFSDVMQTLAEYFKLREEKEKIREKK